MASLQAARLAGNRAPIGQATRLGERLALAQDGPAVQVLESAALQDLGRGGSP